MKKYNCNNTLEYAHEAERMCETFDNCSTCPCPLYGMSCGHLEITAEHINRVQAWSDAHPEIALTDKQVEIFKALNLLGFRYIAKDSDGAVYAFTERPGKGLEAWGGNGEYFSVKVLRSEVSTAISALVNWSDDKPLCIAEALEQAEEAKP
jgi:hypothetical protein